MWNKQETLDWYKGKRVFITGHTGFKGAWACRLLSDVGAQVTGYALSPPTDPALFDIAGCERDMRSIIGDIRDFERLYDAFVDAKPQVVLHMAAQPIVRTSYEQPKDTYDTNVMGTVNILECLRLTNFVQSFVNVTTDKVYQNSDMNIPFTEDMPLDGFDPYSNSKSCSELVTHSYNSSFLSGRGLPVSTARAGNVIGGGDFAKDRILPDALRAVRRGEALLVRNPNSTRPFQHVLEPLFAYLLIAKKQAEDADLAGWYNVGPPVGDIITTGELCDIFYQSVGGDVTWRAGEQSGPHEAAALRLDCEKLSRTFGWQPTWDVKKAVEKTVEWNNAYIAGEDVSAVMARQNKEFVEGEV